MAPDTIELQGLTLDCVLGVNPDERDRAQPVRVDLTMGLDLRHAGRSASISHTIDYDRTATELAALLRFRKYRLLENAAEEAAAMLFGVHPRLQTVTLRIAKPQALPGRAEQAAIRVQRSRADYPTRRELSSFGEVEILLETREAGLYLLHVAAGQEIPRHHHRVMRELEWLVRGTLQQQGEAVPMASPVVWARGQAHDYRNDTDEVATLFCCDCPPFIPDDEIVLPTDPEATSETATAPEAGPPDLRQVGR